MPTFVECPTTMCQRDIEWNTHPMSLGCFTLHFWLKEDRIPTLTLLKSMRRKSLKGNKLQFIRVSTLGLISSFSLRYGLIMILYGNDNDFGLTACLELDDRG